MTWLPGLWSFGMLCRGKKSVKIPRMQKTQELCAILKNCGCCSHSFVSVPCSCQVPALECFALSEANLWLSPFYLVVKLQLREMCLCYLPTAEITWGIFLEAVEWALKSPVPGELWNILVLWVGNDPISLWVSPWLFVLLLLPWGSQGSLLEPGTVTMKH